jgi:hypothetical protein
MRKGEGKRPSTPGSPIASEARFPPAGAKDNRRDAEVLASALTGTTLAERRYGQRLPRTSNMTTRPGLLLSMAAAVGLAGGGLTDAVAQARPDSLTMTCSQARALVASRGAVILGSGADIYDRYVADQRFCSWPDVATFATVRTRESSHCFAGYVCRPPETYDPSR